jgi:hypothetical protein
VIILNAIVIAVTCLQLILLAAGASMVMGSTNTLMTGVKGVIPGTSSGSFPNSSPENAPVLAPVAPSPVAPSNPPSPVAPSPVASFNPPSPVAPSPVAPSNPPSPVAPSPVASFNPPSPVAGSSSGPVASGFTTPSAAPASTTTGRQLRGNERYLQARTHIPFSFTHAPTPAPFFDADAFLMFYNDDLVAGQANASKTSSKEQVNDIRGVPLSVGFIIGTIVVTTILFIVAIIGAVKFNIIMVGFGLVGHITILIITLMSLNFINAISILFIIYPHVFLMKEIHQGIMTADTYEDREKQSCCCT